MKLLDFVITCDQCNRKTKHHTRLIPGYYKPIVKSMWCQNCGEAQVVRFQFTNDEVEILERLEPSDVYVPRKPDTGITIRPRAGKPRQKPS